MLYDDTEISINRCKFQIRKVKVNDINETCSMRGGNEKCIILVGKFGPFGRCWHG